MLTIYDSKGVKRFETPINKGSKRSFTIMGDDYVTLKFSVPNPIYFKLGDYCDVPGFGRFELVEPYQPTYNNSTNGYDYELRLDAQHFKWRNKIMRFLPRTGASECSWTLTATADVHMSQVLENIKALINETLMNGDVVINQQYLYNGVAEWMIVIDDTVEGSAKTINYDSTNIIDALTAIAEAYDCEWWVDGNIIHLGKCEESGVDYVDLEVGVNVESMSRSDSSEDYVTRILVFGSDRNIGPRYRKDLLFDVKAVDNGGTLISDTSRPLESDWFDASMVQTSSSNDTLKRVVGIKIEVIDSKGDVSRTLNGAIYNPDYKENYTERNWIQLPGGAVMALGERFRITNIIENKVKSSYFSSRYSAYDDMSTVVRNGIVTSRLMLPVSHGTPYVDFEPGLTMEEGVEDVVVFEDVYPRAICTVNKVDTVERKETIQNDDGTETETTFIAYRIKDDFFTKDHPFDNDYIIPGKKLEIVFQDGKRYKEGDTIPAGKKVGDLIYPDSGRMNGWTFEVYFTKDDDGSAIWEIVRNNEQYVPNEILHPEIGDQFVLTGFDASLVDDYYVAEAEKELLEKANKYIKKMNTDPSTYDCTMMSDVMKGGLTLGIGKPVNLINEAYIKTTKDDKGRRWGRKSRVIGYEINLDIPYDSPVYTIGEKPAYSKFGEIEDKIDALKFAMSSGNTYLLGGSTSSSSDSSAGAGIYIVKQNDITPASDTNVFSALRSYLEFCSKKATQVINYLWTFTKGIRIGNYVMNNDGAKIDPNGDAEFEEVVIRKGVSVGDNINVGGDVNVGGDLQVSNGITIGDYYQPGAFGGRIWVDDLGKVHIETDYLEAREKIQAKEVEIQEETHVGGCQIISPAAMRCSRVLPVYNDANSVIAYKCFFTAEDEETGAQIYNQFAVGDLAKCETFNLMKQPNGKVGNHYFWRKVIAVGYVEKGDADYDADFGKEGYITLSNLAKEKDAGSDVPLAGDRIITVGNDDPAKSDRANLIILASYGTGSPYIYQYKGITTFALTRDNLKVAISPNGNLFTGKFVIENGKEEIDVVDYIENNIYLEAYQIVLSNEMAAVPTDNEGNIIGDLPSSRITVYKGKTVESGWKFTLDCFGCKASIVNNVIYLSELTEKNATVTVTGTKAECPTLTKVMTICKLKEGEMGATGEHAVEFQIEPDSPMVLADMDGNCDPKKLGCKVYMVIGNQMRVEVPLANTGSLSPFKAGDKLLFFNGKLFVDRPVEADVPTDLILRYVIVNQDYITDPETGKVTPVITSESEHIYTGNPLTMSSRIKHIIFKLYRGNVLLDMQTVIVTTDASAMKVVYDTRFEVNEKEILAHASRISQTEKDITDLRITADGISANVSKQTGIIQDIINGLGRNLLLKTNQGAVNWTYLSDSKTKPTIWPQAVGVAGDPSIIPTSPLMMTNSSRSDGTYEVFTYELRPELIKAGEKYTLSLKVTNNSSQAVEMTAQIATPEGASPLTDEVYFDRKAGVGEYYLTAVLTAKTTGAKTGSQKIYIRIVKADINKWTSLRLEDIKLEKGSTKTAWSPAPEDSSSYVYSKLNTLIEVTAEGIRTEVSREIGESEDRITKAYKSAINQSADEILSQVEMWDDELGASISRIDQKADSISLKVDEIAGYENLVGGNTDGMGWAVTTDSGAEQEIAPDSDGYFHVYSLGATRYLRSARFTLKSATKYTLSFRYDTYLTSTNSVTIKYGSTKTTIATTYYNVPGTGSGNRKIVFTFSTPTTSSGVLEDAYIEFTVPTNNMSSLLTLFGQVMIEEGEVAHPYVDTAAGLLGTGIDIFNKKIIFTANNIIFQNNKGEQSMFIDENGQILAKFINVEELRVSHLIAGDENGQCVEIDPKQKAIFIYNENHELCTYMDGTSYPGGAADVFKDAAGGDISLGSIVKGGLSISGSEKGSSDSKTYYSSVFNATAAPIVLFTQGKLVCTAFSTGYTQNKAPSNQLQDYKFSNASARATISLEMADDSGFTKNVRSFQLYTTSAYANASSQMPSSSTASSSTYPSVSANNLSPANASVLTNRTVRGSTSGYCRLKLEVSVSATMVGSNAAVTWGSNYNGGADLKAEWSGEFYRSNFFANGFCLGISKTQYIMAYKDGTDHMVFEGQDNGFGIQLSKDGLKVKHHNSPWNKIPMLLYHATITAGDSPSVRSGAFSFDGNMPTVTKGASTGRVVITYPTSWQTLGISESTIAIQMVGHRNTTDGVMSNPTIMFNSSNSLDVAVASGGTSLVSYGAFSIQIYLIK